MYYRYDQENGKRFEATRFTSRGRPRVPNPRWHYDTELGITLTVLIEAEDHEAANARAERIGLSFAPEPVPEQWGMELVHQNEGTAPPSMYRWVPVTDYWHGFEEIEFALDDSDEYLLFNPWEVDPAFPGWPVFVHREDGTFDNWNAHVVWRWEYDTKPL